MVKLLILTVKCRGEVIAKTSGAPPPNGEESIGCMEEVKKGKPRKFAVICKGNAVLSLRLGFVRNMLPSPITVFPTIAGRFYDKDVSDEQKQE